MEQSTISHPSLISLEIPSAPEPMAAPAPVPVREPGSFWERTMMLLGVVLPLAGMVAAAVLLWGRGFRWVDLGLLLGMYVATTLGVTVGFHRLFTHRSFETTPIIKFLLAILGCMAVQGPMLKWVAVHRRHHQFSDDIEDPHSPHYHGSGIRGLLFGFWHAHAGWMFDRDPADLPRYVGDLFRDRLLRRVSKTWFPLGGSGSASPRRAGWGHHPLVGGRALRIPVGRSGPCVPSPSCDVEHQLCLSYLGFASLRKPG
jgi:stearoyl-CoA desaturase (delta-9 desaturase)